MRTSNSGFTLLELSTVLAILAIVLTIAQPGFAALVESTRYSTASHELTSSLAMARSAAVTRRHPVTLCPLARPGGGDAEPACGSHTDWNHGWMGFVDRGRTGQPDHADDIIVVHERGGHRALPRIQTTSGRRHVRFAPNGMAGGTNLTLSICAARGNRLLGDVVVSRTGRARSSREAPGTPRACPF